MIERSMVNKSKWIKEGDFNKRGNWAPPYEVSYLSATDDSVIRRIRIKGYDNGKKGFIIHAKEGEKLHFYWEKNFKLLSFYFRVHIFNDHIDIQSTKDLISLAYAVKIIDEVADLGDDIKREFELTLGVTPENLITNSENTPGESSQFCNRNNEEAKLDIEFLQIKKALYSKQGYPFENFSLKIIKPPIFSLASRDIFFITQDDNKEIYLPLSKQKIDRIIELLKEEDTQSLIKLFNKMGPLGFDIARAFKPHSVSSLDNDETHIVDNEQTYPRFSLN